MHFTYTHALGDRERRETGGQFCMWSAHLRTDTYERPRQRKRHPHAMTLVMRTDVSSSTLPLDLLNYSTTYMQCVQVKMHSLDTLGAHHTNLMRVKTKTNKTRGGRRAALCARSETNKSQARC